MNDFAFQLVASLGLDSSAYEKGLDQAKSSGSELGKNVAKATKVGAIAITAAAGATVAFTKKSVDAGKAFDSSMSQVAATMGKSMEEMENDVGSVDLAWGTFSGNLRDYAKEMGANTAFSAKQAADALNYMALAGYSTQESMEMLPNVLNLAAAGSMDLARASDMVTDTQTAFGLSIEDMPQLIDEMAKAASTGNTSVEQLGDAFLTIGGLAQELNGGFITLADGTKKPRSGVQELEIALTAMANAGIKGSEAGTHMRNMLLKLTSPTDDGATAMQALGMEVFDAEGNMRSLKDIFSEMSYTMDTNAVPAVKSYYENLKSMGLSQKEIQKELKKDAEAFTLFGINMVDAEGNIRSFEEVMAEANATVSNGINQQQKLQLISDIFNARDIASAEAMLNAISQDWDSIGESIVDAQGSAQKMADTQLDNLEGDTTKFKSALEGAQIALSDAVTPALRELVQIGTELLGDFTEWIKNNKDKIAEMVKNLADRIANTIKWIVAHGSEIKDAIVKIIKVLAGLWVGDKIAKVIKTVKSAITVIRSLGTVVKTIITVVKTVTTVVKALFAVLAANPIALVIAAIAALVAGFVWLWNNCEEFREFWVNLWEGIKEVTAAVWEAIVGFFTTAWEAICLAFESAGEFFTGVWNSICDAFASVGEFFSGLWEDIKEIFAGVGEWFGGIFSGAWDKIKEAFSGIGKWFGDRWDDIKGVFKNVELFFRGVFQGAKDAVETIIKAMVEVIKTPINWIIDGINTFIRGLNKIQIPDWVWGIGGYGINIPEIPNLETGGILKKGQIGLLEGNGAEAVVPLDQNKKWVQSIVAEMQKQMGANTGQQGDIVIPINIGQRRIETIVIEAQRINSYRSGGGRG